MRASRLLHSVGSRLSPGMRAALRKGWTSRRAPVPGDPPVRHDLKSWALSRPGARYVVLDAAGFAVRELPATLDGNVDPSFVPLCSMAVPERALVTIPQARVLDSGIVVLPTGEMVGELVAVTPDGQHDILRSHGIVVPPSSRTPIPKRGDYISLLGLGMNHYYHWCHDIIMRQRDVQTLLPTDVQLLVPQGLKPFQVETLSLLGLADSPRLSVPPGEYWELERLHVVIPTLKTQLDTPEPYAWFRRAVMQHFGVSEGLPSRRLLLTRKQDDHWRTTNEEAVEAVLAEFGFETVAPARMSFLEQVELFAQAEIIVGTGAGLTNMIFAPPGTHVLQFQEPGRIVHALWTMSEAVGCCYSYLMCDSVPNPNGVNADLSVPEDKLRTAVQRVLTPSSGER